MIFSHENSIIEQIKNLRDEIGSLAPGAEKENLKLTLLDIKSYIDSIACSDFNLECKKKSKKINLV